GIGHAGVVVDHHVDVLEARDAALLAPGPLALAVPNDAMAGAKARDPPERLDVDVDELAGMAALIAIGRLRRVEPGTLAESDPLEPTRHRRERQRQDLSDLGGGHAQLAQRADRFDPRRRQLARRALRPRRAIEQARLALRAEPRQPAPDRALADAGGRGRRRHRPVLDQHPLDKQPAAIRTGARITVELHPVSSLGLSWLRHLSASKGARMAY